MDQKEQNIYYLLNDDEINSLDNQISMEKHTSLSKPLFQEGGMQEDEVRSHSDFWRGSVAPEFKHEVRTHADLWQRNETSDSKDDIEEEEDDDEVQENYLQKVNHHMRTQILEKYHLDSIPITNEKVLALSQVIRDKEGVIIDAFHKTLPMITKYEKARILGERAKQLEAGAPTLIEEHIIDSYLLALREYEQKLIPFIIKRPLPNGKCEYWCFKDLEIID